MRKIISSDALVKKHVEIAGRKSKKDVFFIWMLLILISVIASHLVLNMAIGSPTGYVTARESFDSNTYVLLGSLLAAFILILTAGIINSFVTRKDY